MEKEKKEKRLIQTTFLIYLSISIILIFTTICTRSFYSLIGMITYMFITLLLNQLSCTDLILKKIDEINKYGRKNKI